MYYQNQTMVSNVISCVLEEDKIFQTDYLNGNKTQIGVSLDEYNQKIETLDIYYNKLVELGVIEIEKTPEQIQKENQELINKLLIKIENLEKKVDDTNGKEPVHKPSKKSGNNVQCQD